MKFNIPPEWCEQMARKEIGHEIGAGSPHHPLHRREYEICPKCRNSGLEKSWCDLCDRVGIININ